MHPTADTTALINSNVAGRRVMPGVRRFTLSGVVIMKQLVVAFLLIVSCAVGVSAKDWRGIIPLHSSREEVEKLLGLPHPPPSDGTRAYTMHEGRSIYFLDEGEVYIVYTNGKDPKWADCSGAVPSGTVLLIQVTPKSEVRLSDLPVDQSRLTKFDPSSPPGLGYEGYLDEAEGIVIRAFKGRVEQVSYIAASRDRTLCPGYYENPTSFAGLFVCGLTAPAPCPNIVVTASDEGAEAGATVTFSVSVSGGDPSATPTYKWVVSTGRIVSGQGTSSISVDTSGAAGKTVKATVEVGGYDRSCVTEAYVDTHIKRLTDVKQPPTAGP